MSWQTSITNFVLRRMKPKLANKRGTEAATFLRKQMAMAGDKMPKDAAVEACVIGGVNGEWVSADNVNEQQVLVYFHGGAYVSGSPASHRDYAALMSAELGAKLLMVDYRLAPEYVFPAQIEDAFAVYAGLLAAGYCATDIVVGGDSAGGNLALALLQEIRSQQLAMPQAVALFSPWVDLTHISRSMSRNADKDPMLPVRLLDECANLYVAGMGKNDPLISPAFANYEGFPPMMIHVGETEILLDDATAIADKCGQAGVAANLTVWPKVPHAFPILVKFLPEARQAVQQTATFLRAALD
jgi:acetyl esterase/lipase